MGTRFARRLWPAPPRAAARASVPLLLLALAGLAGAASPDGFPGMRLLARLEAQLGAQREVLRGNPAHGGLVFPVEEPDLLAFLQQIRFQRDGEDVALGSDYGAETHGGGLLALILEHWRPGARPVRLTDRFTFAGGRGSLALAEVQRSHERQVFLPVPGTAPEQIQGRLPADPQLARMRFRYAVAGRSPETIETDAYSLLRLLALREPELTRSWTNHLGQRLSADLLLRQAWDRYLSGPQAPAAGADHSWLHLPEILLSYQRRRAGQPGTTGAALDPNGIKARFLAVELAQTRFEAEDWSENLAHYAESLGHLLSDPDVVWKPAERRAVRAWLADLETRRFARLEGLGPDELCHLLRGLRLVAERRALLE